jgi:4-hydroxy-2-oxoheptanedioate aldolase
VLDIGAQSILVSQVSSADQAKRIADSCRYAPDGSRGLSPFTRNHGYSEKNLKEKLEIANKQMLVGVLVEGEQGIQAIPEIARTKGIDLIYIGIYDLSLACGVPGDLTHPKVLNVMREYSKVINDCGVFAGSVAPDSNYMKILIECDFRFISYRVDSAILRDGYAAALDSFKELCARG